MAGLLFDDDFEELGQDPRRRRRPRVFRDRVNLAWPLPGLFRDRFRITPDTATLIEAKIGRRLVHRTNRNRALSPREQLLITLRFYATAGFYIILGDGHGPATATVCRVVHRVTRVLVHAFANVIRWPADPAAVAAIKQRFYNIAGIPDVVGCIDGTHLRLAVPAASRHIYMNRKGFTSVNCMAVAGPDRQFYAVALHCSGRVHDARVFASSGLEDRFRTTGGPAPHSLLLGDSAYALAPWMMTPVVAPASRAEMAYNRAHCGTRVLVENAFGILKRRFPCLHTGARMREISDSVRVFRACTMLHNVCILGGDRGEWLGVEEPVEEPVEAAAGGVLPDDVPHVAPNGERAAGLQRRQAIVRLFA